VKKSKKYDFMSKPPLRLCFSSVTKVLLIAASVIALFYLVYLTGGTTKVYLQLFYIPIILSAYYWGQTGGTITAALSGL